MLSEPAHARGNVGGVSRRLVAGAALLALVIGGGVGVGVYLLTRPAAAPLTAKTVLMRNGLYGDATWAAGSVRAPAISTLRDQSGGRFALSSLHGHTVAIVFFDSYCRQECPLEGRQLAAAERRLPVAQRPQLVVVSVNPKDTAASVAKAIREWGLAGVAPWHWLMGSHAQLGRIWAEYGIQVSPPVDGDINHTEALYLVDRKGYERAGYLWPFASRFATYDMRALATRRVA
ncbi:MAG TPA: SCO family protein [Solirubrobacteraceae bacterium]|nr:SCO family protein [Solirubrobacteraceae bacterium]